MGKFLYLDANAHLPMSKVALDALVSFNNSVAGHGHSMAPSRPGRAAMTAMEVSREVIAECLGASNPHQIIFTSTCSQACEWGLEIFNNLNQKQTFVSPTEHPAVRQSTSELNKIPINSDGIITNIEFNDDGVICIYMQNEIGVIQPIKDIKCGYLFSDMSQIPGKITINLSSIPNVDIATFGAHKFGGPGGVGFIYLKEPLYWQEFGTGSRYFKDRTGTPDVASIVATAAALEDAIKTLPERTVKMKEFQTTLESGLDNLGIEVIGKGAVERSPNTTFMHIPDGKAMQILLCLGGENIHVGLGSACGSFHSGMSPLMTAMGRSGGAHDFMRVSTYGEYASEDALLFLDKLQECIM